MSYLINGCFYLFVPENIVKEMKELFNVQDGLAVRLWSKYMSSYFERLDRMDLTLQDCSIYTGQVKFRSLFSGNL